jgi:hypothetical protein
VDAQSGIGAFGAGNGGGAAFARACVRAMEDSVKYTRFDDNTFEYSKFHIDNCKSPSTIDNEGMSIGSSNTYGTPDEGNEYFDSNSYSRVVNTIK